MTNTSNKFLASIIILISCFMLSGFFFGKKDTPLPDMPKGSSEVEQTIVVRFDSQPKQFLKDTSDNVKFMAYKTPDKQNIYRLSTPIPDFTPKKFILLDNELGFSADKIHKFTIDFDRETHIWSSILFYPYEPSVWATEKEVQTYIKEWEERAEHAGWKRCGKDNLWEPRMLPNPESKRYKKVYTAWTVNNHRITLIVKRADPGTYKLIKNHPKYNLEIWLANKSKKHC